MDETAITTCVTMLNVDLGDLSPASAVAVYRRQLVETAIRQIEGRGVELDGDEVADMQLVSSWAAWLYRKRDGGGALPDMLREELRSRIVQKALDAEAEA